uniref:Uncharacterized protein n=1 Tax=Anguilla anguilla TaxID=7936 RepID=A0A0E9VTY8_ANGAN
MSISTPRLYHRLMLNEGS